MPDDLSNEISLKRFRFDAVFHQREVCMKPNSPNVRTGIPVRILRISLLIVLGWLTLLIKGINLLSGLLLGGLQKLLSGGKKD